eukprot:m51a1_g6516 hypothetical protein (229) ;mRNA; r:270487-271918
MAEQQQKPWGLFETNYQRSKGITLHESLAEIDRACAEGVAPQDAIIPEYGRVVKVLAVGDSGVGKTALYNAFVYETAPLGHGSTAAPGSLATATDSRVVLVTTHAGQKAQKRANVKVKIWDSSTAAGRSRSNYRSADAVAVVFSTGSRASLDSASRWLAEARESSAMPVMALVANVVPGERAVSEEEGSAAAKAVGFDMYAEADARSAESVRAAVASVVARAFETDKS